MRWVSDLRSRRLCVRGGRRASATAKGAGARFRPSVATSAIPPIPGEAMPAADGTRRMRMPALAPHPTRREASSGVIPSQPRLVEPASDGFRRHT